MTVVIGLAAIVLFALAIRMLNVRETAQGALDRSRTAMSILRDQGKTDLEKEAAARAAGLHLMACSMRLITGLCAAAAPSAALVAGAAATGLTSVGKLAVSLSSPWMLATAFVLSAAAFIPR